MLTFHYSDIKSTMFKAVKHFQFVEIAFSILKLLHIERIMKRRKIGCTFYENPRLEMPPLSSREDRARNATDEYM